MELMPLIQQNVLGIHIHLWSQTLKNNASYQKEVKKHQKEQALLVSLKGLLPATDIDVPPEKEPPAEKQRDTTTKVSGLSIIVLT